MSNTVVFHEDSAYGSAAAAMIGAKTNIPIHPSCKFTAADLECMERASHVYWLHLGMTKEQLESQLQSSKISNAKFTFIDSHFTSQERFGQFDERQFRDQLEWDDPLRKVEFIIIKAPGKAALDDTSVRISTAHAAFDHMFSDMPRLAGQSSSANTTPEVPPLVGVVDNMAFVWALKGDEKEQVQFFQSALFAKFDAMEKPNDKVKFFADLLDKDDAEQQRIVDDMVAEGRRVDEENKRQMAEIVKEQADTCHKTLLVPATGDTEAYRAHVTVYTAPWALVTPLAHASSTDITLVFVKKKDSDAFDVCVRRTKNAESSADCLVLAKAFGGSGNKWSAGFVIEDMESIFE